MSTGVPTRRWNRLVDRAVVLSVDDRFWLTSAVAAGLCVHLVYLLTHPYPAYGAGLYLAIAETIAAHGYGLPSVVPGYTAGGVPLAYPPLGFYVAAAAREATGLGPFAYSRLVPGLLVTLALVPYYFTAKALLDSPRRAGVSTLLLAGTPAALQWHLSAGGIVRGLAFLFAVSGAYVGVRLFRDGDARWVPPAAVLFGLTVLVHPVYAVFFGLTYLVLFGGLSRSPWGLVHGGLVAGGGVLLAAPWWLHVLSVHGPDIFAAAAGTHGGLAGGPARLLSEFVYPIDLDAEAVFFVGAYAGALYALSRGRYLLPAWLFAAGYVVGKPRFLFVAGSMLTATLVFEAGVPTVRRLSAARLGRGRRRLAELAAVGLVVLAAVGSGTAFAAGALSTHDGDPSQPAFVDSDDHEAMAWVATGTDADADFVVLGDAAEWFPLFADRTILVGPWGVEWTEPARYERQLERFQQLSACDRAACITAELAATGLDPDYLYVPKGHYTVRGMSYYQDPAMRASLVASDRYELVYENEGAMVVRVVPSEGGDPAPRTARAAPNRPDRPGPGLAAT